MGNEGSRSNPNGTVDVQVQQQEGLNESHESDTINVDGEHGVIELNENEPTIDPQPIIDKVEEQNTNSNTNIQQNGDQNDKKSVEIAEKKKPKKRSFFSKEKVKLRDKKDKVKDTEKDIRNVSVVADSVKPEVVLPVFVDGEPENQNKETPPVLPEKTGKEVTEKPIAKKKDDKEEKRRLKEEKKRLKEEKKRSKSKKQKNVPEQDKETQLQKIEINTDKHLCVCPGVEDTLQDSEQHKETQNGEAISNATNNMITGINENTNAVNRKVIDTEIEISSNINSGIGEGTSVVPNGTDIISENIVKQTQDVDKMSNLQVGEENLKESVGEALKQNLDQSNQFPLIESDKAPSSDQMTSKDSLNNLLMVEEDVLPLEDADIKTEADDITVEGATSEGGVFNEMLLPAIAQSLPEKINEKISETTEAYITTDVQSCENTGLEKQESVNEIVEHTSHSLCSVTDVMSEPVSECKEVDVIMKESKETLKSEVENELESKQIENYQTKDDSNELTCSVESETNNDTVQEKAPASEEEKCKETCNQSEKDKINSDEVAINRKIENSSESKLESEKEKILTSAEPTTESKLLDKTNNNCNQAELTTDALKGDPVDEKVVSEKDKSQVENEENFVDVNTVSENDECQVKLKENSVDVKEALRASHVNQKESSMDNCKETSLTEKPVLECVKESVSENVTELIAENAALKQNPAQNDKTEEEALSLQSDLSAETTPNLKTVTNDKGNKSQEKSKSKDKKKKDKLKKRSKVNSESSHDNVSVTSSSHSDKTDSPKSENKKDKSKKKSPEQRDIRDNDSTTASECLSNTSDLEHSFSENHKNDEDQCSNDKKVLKDTISVDSHEKRKSGNIFSWNLLKSHKAEEEKDKKKKVKMRGVGKDMIQQTVYDTEETNKRRSIFDEEIHIELDDSHDIVSLSSLESDTNSEYSLGGTSNNKETQPIVNFDELDEVESDAKNNDTNSEQDLEKMTVPQSGPIPDLLITKFDIGNGQEKVSSTNDIAIKENKDEIEKVGKSQILEPEETVLKSHTEPKEKSAIKISIKVESKYADPVIYGTSSYNGDGVKTQTRGTQTDYVSLKNRHRRALQHKEENDNIETTEHKDNNTEERHFSSPCHGFTHKYTLPLVVKAVHRRRNGYGMKKEGKNLIFRRHMSDESDCIATNSCKLTRPLSFQHKESNQETGSFQTEAEAIRFSKYKYNPSQRANEKRDILESPSPSTKTIDEEESVKEKKPKSDAMYI